MSRANRSDRDPSHSSPYLICVAWPYANGPQHIGHMAGAYLPSDVFARFLRMNGEDVLMVSGSDSHGTPVSLRAEKEGRSETEVFESFHNGFIQSYLKFGLTFDLFTHTHTELHEKIVQEFFLDLKNKGLIYTAKSKQIYDRKAKRFLPDRYIEGECPLCGFKDARGDQCDQCGKTYDAVDLKNPRSILSGSQEIEVRETEHFYLDLAPFNAPLQKWLGEEKDHWRRHVLNFSRGEIEKQDLRGRAITRDLEWGVRIPIEGYDDKRIYVWFEAVQGYLSATIEWAQLAGDPEAWKNFWDPLNKGKTYYFIGKDNISFHTILWPAMLMAKTGLNLPYDVPANEYLNSYGRKFSKSRGTSIEISQVLERYQVDAWRYALMAIAPETGDVDFTWDDFLEKVNNELVANWGNLVNRVLGFAFKRFDGKVPMPQDLIEADHLILKEVRDGFSSVGQLYQGVKLRAALEEARRLSQKVNQYLSDHAPWTTIKTDPQRAGTIVYVALQCIDWLKTMWAPILIESSQMIHESLGYEGQLFGRQYTQEVQESHSRHLALRYDHSGAVGVWDSASVLKPGQIMAEPKAPFIKLDPKIVEQEVSPAP
jgi:methionyl-tRNA synthetase